MGRTVKVRIAVAVTQSGKWAASGWTDAPEDVVQTAAAESCDAADGYAFSEFWITATLPVPEPVEVEGVVEEADDA